jgi:hypothetical protein
MCRSNRNFPRKISLPLKSDLCAYPSFSKNECGVISYYSVLLIINANEGERMHVYSSRNRDNSSFRCDWETMVIAEYRYSKMYGIAPHLFSYLENCRRLH